MFKEIKQFNIKCRDVFILVISLITKIICAFVKLTKTINIYILTTLIKLHTFIGLLKLLPTNFTVYTIVSSNTRTIVGVYVVCTISSILTGIA